MLRPIIFTFIVRFAGAILNFLVIILLSRELGAEGKGICAKYIAVIANALIFCDFLGGPSLVFMVARYRVTNILLPAYLWSAFTSVAVMYVFYLLGELQSNEFIFLSALSFLNSAIAIHQNILSGRMQFFKLNIIILLQSALIYFSLRYFLSLAGPMTATYVWALGLAWGFAALLGFFFVLNLENSGEKIRLGKFIKSAFGYGTINISGHVLQFFNQRLSYFLLGDKLLGVFSNAVSIGESVWMISNSIATVQYGKISNTKIKEHAERISLVLLKINLVFCLAASIVLALLPDQFFVWVFNPEFAGIHGVLLYLFPGLVFYSGYLILGHHFSGLGKFAKNLYCIGTGLVFTLCGLAIAYTVTPGFGMTEAALITSVSYLGNFVAAYFIFSREAGTGFKDLLPSRADLSFIRSELKRKSNAVSGTE